MALYEYVCHDCETKFEALRPMSQADAAIPCKQCTSLNTARVLSLFASVSGKSSPASPCDTCETPGQGGPNCACGGSCGHHHH